MRRENNGGFTMIEVLVAIAILAGIVIPVCSSLLLSLRMNAKAEQVLQARLAVSSAVETLMAEGIDTDTIATVRDKFAVTISAEPENSDSAEPAEEGAGEEKTVLFKVTVSDTEGLVTVDTYIRAAEEGDE